MTSIAFLIPVNTATSTASANSNPSFRTAGAGSQGISSGAVVGIVIGAVAILLLIFTFISLEIRRGFFSKSHWVKRTKTAIPSDVEIKTEDILIKKQIEKEKAAEAGVWEDIPFPPPPPAYNDVLSVAQQA